MPSSYHSKRFQYEPGSRKTLRELTGTGGYGTSMEMHGSGPAKEMGQMLEGSDANVSLLQEITQSQVLLVAMVLSTLLCLSCYEFA